MLRRLIIPGLAGFAAIGGLLSYTAFAEGGKSSSAIVVASNELATVLAPEELEQVGERESFISAYRRLTESQYRHAIADIFGDDIKVEARFEPERREEGLQAVGNAQLSVTTSGLEQYYSLARSISRQVVSAERETDYLPCDVTSSKDAARKCADEFVQEIGGKLYRRPLTKAERTLTLTIWDASAEGKDDYTQAFEHALTSLLISPEFLFRTEVAERVDDSDAFQLDAYSKASRLAFYLWDSPPDAELLEAAARGDLNTLDGLSVQVERLLDSPRFDLGVRAFFTDMLHFESFETLTKDTMTYPKFSQAVADSAREETLRFLIQHLVDDEGDYRDIFTTKKTVLNRTLAAVYNVPYPSREEWTTYEFDEDTERSGILTQVSFAALFSHPGSSSPTLRGKHLQEIFQCTKIPDPPADVDFSKVQAIEEGTVRERLDAHRTDPTCASCHILMDPAGLALENFDSLGQFRTLENGDPIDVSADIFGQEYSGATGVGEYMKSNPQVVSCVVQKAYAYGKGRKNDYREGQFLNSKTEEFADAGYQLKDLFRSLLTDPKFYEVEVPEGLSARTDSASLTTKAPASGGN